MGIGVVAKNHLQPPSTMFLQQIIWKLRSKSSRSFIRFNISYVIRMSFACACILPIYTRIPFVCQSYIFVCHSYVTRLHSYVICMSLVCSFAMNPWRVQIWKKTFCQNSDYFGYCFIKNDIMFMYLLCIYKKSTIFEF